MTPRPHGPPRLILTPDRTNLRDGQRVALTLVSEDDHDDLRSGFQDLSPRSRYLRFFSSMPRLPELVAEGLARTDGRHHVAVGARLIGADGELRAPMVGVARYYRADPESDVAEPAVAVIDRLHGLGLGQLLMRRLARIARHQGVSRFRAFALMDNKRVRQMLQAANGVVVEEDGPVLVYDLDLRARDSAGNPPVPQITGPKSAA